MSTTIQKDSIVNGSFNHDLTDEEMLSFEFDTKKTMAWYLVCGLNHVLNMRGVDSSVFTETQHGYKYDMFTEENIDSLLIEIRNLFRERLQHFLNLTYDKYVKDGANILKAQKELGFGGFLEMDYRKLIGYVKAQGNYNNRNSNSLAKAIDKLQKEVPKFYKLNNPNNGMTRHIWKVNDDYVIMSFPYLRLEEVEIYEKFYKETFVPVGNSLKADSIRIEKMQLCELTKSHSIELILWWD